LWFFVPLPHFICYNEFIIALYTKPEWSSLLHSLVLNLGGNCWLSKQNRETLAQGIIKK
jgi:hypothetical protein